MEERISTHLLKNPMQPANHHDGRSERPGTAQLRMEHNFRMERACVITHCGMPWSVVCAGWRSFGVVVGASVFPVFDVPRRCQAFGAFSV